VPDGTPGHVAEVADEAFAAMVEVMRGNVKVGARERLSAAAALREEICGPQKQETKHSGGVVLQVVTGVSGAPTKGAQWSAWASPLAPGSTR
jgi:hypothetical protein